MTVQKNERPDRCDAMSDRFEVNIGGSFRPPDMSVTRSYSGSRLSSLVIINDLQLPAGIKRI